MSRPPVLSNLQKRQVALLYHFASLDYLQGLLVRLNDLLDFVDATLNKAKLQRRNQLLTDPRWGTRNTSQSWSNHAWQFLADFQRDVVEDIAKRQFDSYGVTGSNQCARGLAEYSMAWMTEEEEAEFGKKFHAITAYAYYIDVTMRKPDARTSWDDFLLTKAWQEQGFEPLPRMQVRSDVRVRSGDIPRVTGVYISLDDVNASPQFAWASSPEGELMDAATFNGLGLAALQEVGRNDLWFDEQKMSKFLQSKKSDPSIQHHWSFQRALSEASLAPSYVSRFAFQYVPTTWSLVEIVPGEFETNEDNGQQNFPTRMRVPAG